MLKNLFGRMGCAVGAHTGPWEETDAPCTTQRQCSRCAHREERTTHDLGEWHRSAPDRCETVRACTRCGHQETGEAHDWRWKPGPAPCMQVQVCARCAAQAPDSRIEHTWGAWHFDDTAGQPVHNCSVCSLPSHAAIIAAVAHRSPQPDEALTAAVDAYLGADSVAGQRAVVEANAAAFFSVSMDPYLQRALQTFADHAQLAPALRALWVLLRRCHQGGTEAAFQRQPLDLFAEKARALVTATQWRDKQRILIQNPLLYDARMAPWWAQLEAAAPAEEKETISAHRTLLELCRAQGVLATLTDLVEPLPPPPPPPPEPVLDPQLVGTWENRDMLGYGGVTMVSYTTLVFAPGGRFVRSSRMRGGATFADSHGQWAGTSSLDSGADPGERGHWATNNGAITLSFDDGHTEVLRGYTVYPDALHLPSTLKRLWQRL